MAHLKEGIYTEELHPTAELRSNAIISLSFFGEQEIIIMLSRKTS
jgi:hypothetical protein